jgi:hypothetical protein
MRDATRLLAALALALAMGSAAQAQAPTAVPAPADPRDPPSAAREAYREIHAFDRAERARLEQARLEGMPSADVAMLAAQRQPIRLALDARLRALRQAGAPKATFFWGVVHFERGVALLGRRDATRARDAHFAEAQAAFIEAERQGEAGAAWNLSLMHKRGWGVPVSRSNAAEWAARGGERYAVTGDTDRARASLKNAEELDAGHPAVARLKGRLAGHKP